MRRVLVMAMLGASLLVVPLPAAAQGDMSHDTGSMMACSSDQMTMMSEHMGQMQSEMAMMSDMMGQMQSDMMMGEMMGGMSDDMMATPDHMMAMGDMMGQMQSDMMMMGGMMQCTPMMTEGM